MQYTTEEIATHNKIDDCWIIVYDNIYNITNFMEKEHPGGFIPLSIAGMDTTNLFISTHPSYVDELLVSDSPFYKKYYVGEVCNKVTRDDTLYYKLKKEVETYMKKNNLKARDNILFELEIILLFIMTVYTYFEIFSSNYKLFFSIFHSIMWSFLLTRTIHDSNHGGLTKHSEWKRYLVTFIPEIFSSNYSWQMQHNRHHMHTNHIDKDPDTKFDPIFRITKTTKNSMHYKLQPIYAFLLYPLYTFKQMVYLHYSNDNKAVEPMHQKMFIPAKLILVGYWGYSIYNEQLLWLILSHLIAGFYLSILFIVSHTQSHLIDENRNENSFLEEQLSTTIDYNTGCEISNIVSHGLNHQTIHHLFPSINYHHYPRLTTDVLIPFCKTNNLKYNGNITFKEAVVMHINTLIDLS